jgi:hypothetical protein
MLQEVDPHTRGLVSRLEAEGFTEALTRVAKSGGATLGADLYLVILDVIRLFGRSGFTVTELASGDTVIFRR